MIITTADLLESVKRNQSVDVSGFRFTDTDILEIADECIRDIVYPTILSLNSDRLIFTEYITLAAGTTSYNMPYRATGSTVADISWQDTNDESPTVRTKLTQYSFADAEQIIATGASNFYGYYFVSNSKIGLLPKVAATGSGLGYLKVSYYIQHPYLKEDSSVATISSVDYNTGVVTLASTIPTTFTTSEEYDFILANRKSVPRILAIDKTASVASGTSMTFTVADIPTGLVAGDRICLSEQSDVLLLPHEAYKFVCKHVESVILEAQGDLQKLNKLESRLVTLRRSMEQSLTPRNSSEANPFTNDSPLLFGNNRRLTFRIFD